MTARSFSALAFWGVVVAVVAIGGAIADLMLLAPIRSENTRILAAQTARDELLERREHAVAALRARPAGDVGTASDMPFLWTGELVDVSQQLQERIRDALSSAGALPLTSQFATFELASDLTKLQILLRADLSEVALMTFLKQVESANPKIVVEALEVHKIAQATGETLELTATLSALYSHAH